ncbi:hypothetical protein ACFYU9_02630 [Streptomyces sp. NPDC004327]|uniref:hypothetical protein n=1 Tax=unclassified Streptomyces TaxID=2593676 RepID=UPI0036C711A4
MSAAVRRLLVAAALVAGAGLAAGHTAGPRDATTDTTGTGQALAAGLLDTSWGDDYTRPEL